MINMTKTSSTRIKAKPQEETAKGKFLLYTGIISLIIAVLLFIMWIVIPEVFIVYIIPLLVIFIPLFFYAFMALAIYSMKFRGGKSS